MNLICQCNQQFQVADEHAGKTIPCPACGNLLRVPAALPPAPGPSASTQTPARTDGVLAPGVASTPSWMVEDSSPAPRKESVQAARPAADGLSSPATQTVPQTDSGRAPVEGAPAETAKAPSAELDLKKLKALVLAYLTVPLYMLSLLVLLVLYGTDLKLHKLLTNSGGRTFLFVLGLVLIGVGYRSLECIYLLWHNPFKAYAMGRYIFVIFMVLNGIDTVLGQWPRDEVTAPATARLSGAPDGVVALKEDQVQMKEVSYLSYLSPLTALGSQVAQQWALLVFLGIAYQQKRGKQKEYLFKHFQYDVSFGRLGESYGWK